MIDNDLQKEVIQLREENEQLRTELEFFKKSSEEKTFKEKFAVRILDSLPDMLTVFNGDGVGVEVVSNESTNHVGLTNEQFKGMRMHDMIPPDAFEKVYSNFEKVKVTGEGSISHHELNFQGKHHYYENRIFPLDKDYLLIMCRDISESVATQRKVSMFKEVLDRIENSVLCVSPDGTLIYANKQFIKEYGVSEPLGIQKIYDLPVSFDSSEKWDEKLSLIRSHGGNYSYRAAYVPMNSHTQIELVHQVSCFVMYEENEERIWLFTQDITDLVNSRDEFREVNRLLEAVINNIPVCLFVKDPSNEYRYLYWNKAFERSSQIPSSRAIGKTDFEIFPDENDAKKFRHDDEELIETRQELNMQETYTAASGDTRLVQTSKILVPQEDGRMPLIVGISWDITDMQSIEKELVNARIKAEQSDKLKSAFLANMSHEIRTPLNAIVGFSKLLTSSSSPDELKLYSDVIDQNSEILLQLINDILDLSKIEAGTLEYIRKPMNLGELFRTIYEVHKEKVQPGVSLIWDNVGDDIAMEEDYNRIMQVMTNFITNAIKFTKEGEIRFGFIRNKKGVELYVEDTGTGITLEKQAKIFERFVKLNSFAQGTGLGLSICRTIVEKIGGTINLKSEVGKGSRFSFVIPLKS